MKADSFTRQLGQGKVPAVCLLYGEEPLLIEECIARIRKALTRDGGSPPDQEVFHGSEADAGSVLQSAATLSLFSRSKLVLLKGVDAMADAEREGLLDYVTRPRSGVTLVLTAGKPDMRKRFFARLCKACPCVRFYHPYDLRETERWIRAYLRRHGFGIEPAAVEALYETQGRELQVLRNELDKLMLYRGAPGDLGLRDVAALSGQTQEQNAFALADALAERNMERALAIHARLREQGVPAVVILGAVTAKFRKLWAAKSLQSKGCTDAEILRALGMRYRGDRFLKALEEFREEELESLFPLWVEIDEAIKGQKGSPETWMEIAMVRVCRRDLCAGAETVHLAREG